MTLSAAGAPSPLLRDQATGSMESSHCGVMNPSVCLVMLMAGTLSRMFFEAQNKVRRMTKKPGPC